eukprot:g13610.t1
MAERRRIEAHARARTESQPPTAATRLPTLKTRSASQPAERKEQVQNDEIFSIMVKRQMQMRKDLAQLRTPVALPRLDGKPPPNHQEQAAQLIASMPFWWPKSGRPTGRPVVVLMTGPLKFNGWPTLMTAATLPMLVFCIYRLNIEEHMAWFWADFYGLGLVALGLFCGLGPAFFPRVDHPLHELDRLPRSCGGICLITLFALSWFSNGALYVFMRLRPEKHLSLAQFEFDKGKTANAGLVILEGARLDLSRAGAAASCDGCSASECALRDCRREAGLSNVSSKIPLLRMDDLEVENSEVGRRLTGAGVAGGGGAMDNAIAQQLPERLKACDGQQAVPDSQHWWSSCHSMGFTACRETNLAGKCCCPTGFRETSLLVHLRRSVAEVFSVEFPEIGLAFGGQLLSPDLDFKTLGDLGIYDGCTVSFIQMGAQAEVTPRNEKLAGRSEGNFFTYFNRSSNVPWRLEYAECSGPHSRISQPFVHSLSVSFIQ